MKSDILEDLFHHELLSLYSAETQLLNVLPKLAGAAHQKKLQTVFKKRLSETAAQLKRLEQIAMLMKKSLSAPKCRVMEQRIEEAERLLDSPVHDVASDAKLIAAAQHLEGYEIEGYRIARNLASRLGLDEVEALLQSNLDEEEATAAKLAKLAKSIIDAPAEYEDDPIVSHGIFSTLLGASWTKWVGGVRL